MGYFSNGAEGTMYLEHFCGRCKNWKKDDLGVGCAVWDAHMLFSTYGNTLEHKARREVLNVLIPENKDGCHNDACKMFNPKRKLSEVRD